MGNQTQSIANGLPPHVWARVSDFLAPADRRNFAAVNYTLYGAAPGTLEGRKERHRAALNEAPFLLSEWTQTEDTPSGKTRTGNAKTGETKRKEVADELFDLYHHRAHGYGEVPKKWKHRPLGKPVLDLELQQSFSRRWRSELPAPRIHPTWRTKREINSLPPAHYRQLDVDALVQAYKQAGRKINSSLEESIDYALTPAISQLIGFSRQRVNVAHSVRLARAAALIGFGLYALSTVVLNILYPPCAGVIVEMMGDALNVYCKGKLFKEREEDKVCPHRSWQYFKVERRIAHAVTVSAFAVSYGAFLLCSPAALPLLSFAMLCRNLLVLCPSGFHLGVALLALYQGLHKAFRPESEREEAWLDSEGRRTDEKRIRDVVRKKLEPLRLSLVASAIEQIERNHYHYRYPLLRNESFRIVEEADPDHPGETKRVPKNAIGEEVVLWPPVPAQAASTTRRDPITLQFRAPTFSLRSFGWPRRS